jgi:hypothetical protein
MEIYPAPPAITFINGVLGQKKRDPGKILKAMFQTVFCET